MVPATRPNGKPRVCGVVVTYRPELQALLHLLQAVATQLDDIVIVNNGSDDDLAGLNPPLICEIIHLGDNFGIAKAQNIGIGRARQREADYVLLLDQDSLPASNMVASLLGAMAELQASNVTVAGVGPLYTDERQGGTNAFVYLDGLRLKRRHCPAPDSIVETDFLIASGCLISMPSLDLIGTMVEDLFIDYVDIEWGLRARHMGYRSFGVCSATMTHALGDEWLGFFGRRIPVHSPLRHYYHVRNAIWLCSRRWISLSWKLVLLFRLIQQFIFFSLFARDGLHHAWMMTAGFYDGFTGKMGKK